MRSLQETVSDPAYLEFFGLTRPPFARLVDPSQLFHTEQYSLLLENLAEATDNADSLVVLCGADGTGRSTLLNSHISTIGEHVSYVVVNDSCKDEVEFYATLLKQIGFGEITGTLSEFRNITKEFLVCRGIAGDHILIIFDNAHLADPRILEQLRWLCGIKIKDRRVLSVVLAGNAGLVRVVDAPAMRNIKFRSHVVFSIRAYTEEETASYVWHRLRLAGGDAGVKIPQESYARIHRYSGGIPSQINDLCHATLAEAHALNTRVIDEQIVRIVADKKQLLPHVIPLHGKGRRRTDPDFQHLQLVPDSQDSAKADSSQTIESAELEDQPAPDLDPESLLQRIAQLSEQVEDLRADKTRAIQDIEARNNDITELREELGSQSSKVEELKRSLDGNADEITRQHLALSHATDALQDSESRSKQLVFDLESEKRARQVAESELAAATASVADHKQLIEELQTTIGALQADLEAGLKVADQRAIDIEQLKKNSAELKGEIDEGTGRLDSLQQELDSRNQELAHFEKQLEESTKARASAERRIVELKSPEELREIESVADGLAADLEKERRARESAEIELAVATAAVDELNQHKQALDATVGDLEARLKDAGERAAELEVLQRESADLKAELERETGDSESLKIELDSLRNDLDSRTQELGDLEVRLEESLKERELAEIRISGLHEPTELQKVRKTSNRRAADLRKQSRARKTAEKELAKATATVDELSQLKQELRATIGDLEAELKSAKEHAAEFDVLEQQSADQQAELEQKTNELGSLRDEIKLRNEILADLEIRFEQSQSACELAQQRLVELKSPREVEEIEKTSENLAADLEKERHARETLENELAEAVAAVDGFSQLKQEHQAVIDRLQADIEAGLNVADERAARIAELETNTAELEAEIEARTGELDSLRQQMDSRGQELGDLEKRLKESEQQRESAELRIAELKTPQELEEIQKAADNLAAELDNERGARESAEQELVEATALVDELSQLKQELQATVGSLQADIDAGRKVADERAAEIDGLQAMTAKLDTEIEGRDKELNSLRNDLDSRNKTLVRLRKRLSESQNDCKLAQLRLLELKSPKEIEEIEKTSQKLAADLETERHARESLESELAEVATAVDDLNQLKEEHQATVDSLQADIDATLKVVDERAADMAALDESSARLEAEIESKIAELASQTNTVADLEIQLEESRAESRSAQARIAELRDPEELKNIEKASAQLAADLEKERLAREQAENELAGITASVEELSQLKQELQATVDVLQADMEVGLKVADERAAEIRDLEKKSANLEGEIQSRNVELISLREQLGSMSPDAIGFEKERRAKEKAESELADAKATIDELQQLQQQLHATIRELNVDLRMAGERAVDIYSLERNVSDLRDELDRSARQLESRNQAISELEAQLAASKKECELLRRPAHVVSINTAAGSTGADDAVARDSGTRPSGVAEKFEKSMRKIPAYQSLREYDEGFYNGLVLTYEKLMEQGLTEKQANDVLRTEQAELMERLLPRASNSALLDYARLIVDQLDEYQLDGVEPCLKLLVPEAGPDSDSLPEYAEHYKDRELDLLGKTLKSYHAIRPLPAEEDVWPDLEPIFAELFNAFGADNVAAMQNSYDPDIDRLLVCNVTRALYSGILNMSKAKASNALRWLLST